MKVLFVITLTLITFSVTRCGNSVGNKMSTDFMVTTPMGTTIDEENTRSNFDIMSTMIDCNDTFRVEMSYLENLNKSGSFPDETDKTPKCFVRCVLEQSDILIDDDGFNVTRTAEVFTQIRDIPQDDIIKIANACSERPEKCKCEKSYQYLKCLLEAAIQMYEKSSLK